MVFTSEDANNIGDICDHFCFARLEQKLGVPTKFAVADVLEVFFHPIINTLVETRLRENVDGLGSKYLVGPKVSTDIGPVCNIPARWASWQKLEDAPQQANGQL